MAVETDCGELVSEAACLFDGALWKNLLQLQNPGETAFSQSSVKSEGDTRASLAP